MKGGLVSDRIDDTPVYVEDVVQMTGTVIAEDAESIEWEDVESSEPTGAVSTDFDEFVDHTAGGEGPHQANAVPRHGSRKARGHSGSKKGDGPMTVGGRTTEAIRIGKNTPLYSERVS